MESNLLVDASNVMWKAHFGYIQKHQNTSNYGDVYVFISMLQKYKKMYPNSTMWLVWDKKLDREVVNPRKVENANYKNNRDADTAQEVFTNGDIISKICSTLNIKNFFPGHLEADDCIAWLTTKLENCIIFSSDQDFAQLVSDNVSLYNITKKHLITKNNFESVYAMTPDRYLIYKCAIGDPADNVAGVPGYGKKKSTAVALKWPNVSDEVKSVILENLKIIDLKNNNFLDETELSIYNQQYENLTTENTFDILKFKKCMQICNIKTYTENKQLTEFKSLFSGVNKYNNINIMLQNLNIVKGN